ncbi:superoxide dismutase [Hyphomicrobium nitrativorans NL23]|uniref:Superoxide dismutase n=1 Tax=Hyphomicrobium nitrativorans NL23 TaxID=1029756 RepID=V5SCR9_9HYPH|nr:superoxide dismutase [Hyphomicrobium nitrativorans]AHB48298.1 superoxide dismutase [Hyphomicrobium nitrativorans NL23]
MLTPNRRGFLFAAGAATIATAVSAGPFFGQVFADTPAGPFELPALPYDPAALEPHIDAATMNLHHGKHHQAYVTNLNKALADHGDLAKQPLEELLAKLNDVPESIRTTVRNNGGGHANHSMFWQIMGAPGGTSPEGELKDAIDRDLGGLDKLQTDFNAAGGRVFGSGWVFVTVDKDGKLALTSKPNQDTPLMDGGRVLFGNDVWEHAYYLKYQNKRADYLKAWWNVVNWNAVAERYAAAKAGTLKI